MCLACRIPRMALLDRRLDSPAAFAILLVSHAGRSLLPPPGRQPIGSAGADRLFLYVIGCRRWGRLSKELEEDADCPDQAFQAHLNKRRPAPEAGTGRAFDLPIHPRSGRSEQNKRRSARLHLDRSMLEASRHVTSLGPGVPMTDPRGQWSHHRRHAYRDALQCPGGPRAGPRSSNSATAQTWRRGTSSTSCTMLRVVAISNANQNLRFARRTSTLRTVIGYHRLPPRRGGTWRRFNSLATAP